MNNKQNFMEDDLNQIVVPTTEVVKPKKRGKVILIIVLLVIAVAVGLYFGYQKLAVNPKSVFTNAINGTYELVDGYLNENLNRTFSLNPMEEAFVLNAEIEIGGMGEDVEAFDGYQFDLALGVDYPSEILNLDLDASYNLVTGTLAPGESITYNLYLWIDENANTDIMNQTFTGRVLVYSYM